MGWLVSLLGVALALCGAVSLANGISYLRLDWGATEVMAGTTALSAGIVTFALGAVLFALRGLKPGVARATAAPAMARDTAEARDATGVGLRASRAPVAPASSVRPATMGATAAALGGTGGSGSQRGFDPGPADREFDLDPARGPVDLDAVDHRSAAPVDADLAAPAFEATPAESLDGPTVVGRYEANGASYVLFSDGTIEVETEAGTHRFASMADLKDHIDRQDAV